MYQPQYYQQHDHENIFSFFDHFGISLSTTEQEIVQLLVLLMHNFLAADNAVREPDTQAFMTDLPMRNKPTVLPPLMSPFTSPVITLVVGGPDSPSRETQPTHFHVHRSLLLKHSPIFRVMLGGSEHDDAAAESSAPASWTESKKNVLELPEDRAADCAMLLRWLYSSDHSNNSEFLPLHQPGLEHEEIDDAVQRCRTWRDRNGSPQNNQENTMHGPSFNYNDVYIDDADDASRMRPFGKDDVHAAGSRERPPTLHHGPWAAMLNTIAQSAAVARDALTKDPGSETTTTDNPRPEPPALGPLIRLYILADKYLISEASSQYPTSSNVTKSPEVVAGNLERPNHIKYQILLRLQTINRMIKVVPDREDVDRLWSSITVDAKNDPLKMGILKMYAMLSQRERKKIVYDDTRRWNYDFLMDLFVVAPGQTNVPVTGGSW